MMKFVQCFNICSSKSESGTAPFVSPGYAPGNSEWWLCRFVLILLLQVQIRRQITSATKTQIYCHERHLHPKSKCVAFWLDQGFPTFPWPRTLYHFSRWAFPPEISDGTKAEWVKIEHMYVFRTRKVDSFWSIKVYLLRLYNKCTPWYRQMYPQGFMYSRLGVLG